jgi:8-oxo-dGTP pyrophosphatase MutT (NUDIX family)
MEQRDIVSDREFERQQLTAEFVVGRLQSEFDSPRRRSNEDAGGDAWSGEMGELTPASVLVPLVVRTDALTVLLTRRTEHLDRHAGQISFPGGRADEDDESPLHTALRETEEEVGLHRRHVNVIGELDQYVVGTGYLVNPYIGLIEPPFDLTPDDGEVAEIFEVPLDFVMDPENHRRGEREANGVRRHYFFIDYQDYHIWGATAGMLRNLSERLGQL